MWEWRGKESYTSCVNEAWGTSVLVLLGELEILFIPGDGAVSSLLPGFWN